MPSMPSFVLLHGALRFKSKDGRTQGSTGSGACCTEEFSSGFVLPGPPGCALVSDHLKQVRSEPGRRVRLDVFSVLQQPIARCRVLCITGNVVNVAEAKERADFESESRSAGMPRIHPPSQVGGVFCFEHFILFWSIQKRAKIIEDPDPKIMLLPSSHFQGS